MQQPLYPNPQACTSDNKHLEQNRANLDSSNHTTLSHRSSVQAFVLLCKGKPLFPRFASRMNVFLTATPLFNPNLLSSLFIVEVLSKHNPEFYVCFPSTGRAANHPGFLSNHITSSKTTVPNYPSSCSWTGLSPISATSTIS